MDGESYTELQNKWLKNSGVKVGDTVRCISSLQKRQSVCGWGDSWAEEMAVGDTGEVVDIDDIYGLLVAVPSGLAWPDGTVGWRYPFFVLVKLEDK